MARDAVDQRLEQQQRSSIDSMALRPRAAASLLGEGGIDRRQPRQAHRRRGRRPTSRGPCRASAGSRSFAPRPWPPARPPSRGANARPPRAGRQPDQRHVEHDGRRDHLRLAPVVSSSTSGMAADQRQDDHPVQADQQARRRRVVDRRDAALRRAGPEPGAEHEVERPPIEQAEGSPGPPAAARPGDRRPGQATRRAATTAPAGQDIEQYGMHEGAQRRMADHGGRRRRSRARLSNRRASIPRPGRPRRCRAAAARSGRPRSRAGWRDAGRARGSASA